MKFASYTPCEQLRPYIESFAIQEVDIEQTYKVLPGTRVVMGFQYSGSLCHIEDKEERKLSSAGITGLLDGFRIFRNVPQTGTVLVFFREGGAAAFFRQPLHELFRQSLPLETLLSHSVVSLLQEQLFEAKTDQQKIHVIERFMLSAMASIGYEQDHLVSAAVRHIHENNGDTRINDLVKLLHTSHSPLERRFRKLIGTSPKKYASIVRLQHIVQSLKPGSSLPAAVYNNGYYDQAHFIKQFKTFTGLTPERFLHNLK
jgi:AraC-like DNA-binding protein